MKTKKSILVITTIFVFLFASVASGTPAKKQSKAEKLKKVCTVTKTAIGIAGAAATIVTPSIPGKIAAAALTTYGVNKLDQACDTAIKKLEDSESNSGDSDSNSDDDGNSDSDNNTGNSGNNQQQQNNNNGTN